MILTGCATEAMGLVSPTAIWCECYITAPVAVNDFAIASPDYATGLGNSISTPDSSYSMITGGNNPTGGAIIPHHAADVLIAGDAAGSVTSDNLTKILPCNAADVHSIVGCSLHAASGRACNNAAIAVVVTHHAANSTAGTCHSSGGVTVGYGATIKTLSSHAADGLLAGDGAFRGAVFNSTGVIDPRHAAETVAAAIATAAAVGDSA